MTATGCCTTGQTPDLQIPSSIDRRGAAGSGGAISTGALLLTGYGCDRSAMTLISTPAIAIIIETLAIVSATIAITLALWASALVRRVKAIVLHWRLAFAIGPTLGNISQPAQINIRGNPFSDSPNTEAL